jgi:hypothetical protein
LYSSLTACLRHALNNCRNRYIRARPSLLRGGHSGSVEVSALNRMGKT